MRMGAFISNRKYGETHVHKMSRYVYFYPGVYVNRKEFVTFYIHGNPTLEKKEKGLWILSRLAWWFF